MATPKSDARSRGVWPAVLAGVVLLGVLAAGGVAYALTPAPLRRGSTTSGPGRVLL